MEDASQGDRTARFSRLRFFEKPPQSLLEQAVKLRLGPYLQQVLRPDTSLTLKGICLMFQRLFSARTLFGALSSSAFACLLSVGGGAAASRAQSFNEMASEASAQQFYADVQDRISASTHDGETAYFSQRYEMTPELEAAMEQRRQDDETVNRLRADPVFMRYYDGYWEHYQARDDADPGEFCAATYVNLNGSITLTGSDERWDGGLLMFVGKDIPQPEALREITATLTQDDERPATVRVYNLPASPEMAGHGTLIFAFPSMADALSGMEDDQQFIVSIEGEEVFRMSWKDGSGARNTLRRCVRER